MEILKPKYAPSKVIKSTIILQEKYILNRSSELKYFCTVNNVELLTLALCL